MSQKTFVAEESLDHIRHYLPTQAPLKDFIHHNTLHAFQQRHFFKALQDANEIFGSKTCFSLDEFRLLYQQGKINEKVLEAGIDAYSGNLNKTYLKQLLFDHQESKEHTRRIGKLRSNWKKHLEFDPGSNAQPLLFKLTSSYLDQGIGQDKLPASEGLLKSISEIQRSSLLGIIKSARAEDMLLSEDWNLKALLKILIGDESYYEQYLADLLFENPGWSGMVSVLEEKPHLLFLPRKISLYNFTYLALLLELDALDKRLGEGGWQPLCTYVQDPPVSIFKTTDDSLTWELKRIWQEAFEFTYFDQVLKGVESAPVSQETPHRKLFQAFFCIDDREESIRRHIEALAPECQTFGTPAHFNLPIYYRPAGGKFNTQVCPAPITPKHIIVDDRSSEKNKRDLHFNQHSHGLFGGWIIAQTLGFWSALKLFGQIFKPTVSPAQSSSFEHMSHRSQLIIEHKGQKEGEIQVGFTLDEMVNIVEQELKRAGLVENFAPLVYLFGHGGSSTNNPYYAGYNCGACSGKPSSLNARVFASMANREDVRDALVGRGIHIARQTWFIGGLHDTTRDEFVYYDLSLLDEDHFKLHRESVILFEQALELNAKERSRQFMSIDTADPVEEIHKQIKRRSIALFEPRPELNHSNNCLCIVGRRSVTKHLFLDQRAFLNSYDYRTDSDGENLLAILKAATPVCGGINLEYYFSRTDPENFGSGSKLPHNVVGLFGLSNGIEGDLRTGLPTQMTEVHDPLRLMMIVEQDPERILEVLDKDLHTKEWYINEWVKLTCVHPVSGEIFHFKNGAFERYRPIQEHISVESDMIALSESTHENLPVSIIAS